MNTWLITRYLLARSQQLKGLLSGFRTARQVRVSLRWGATVLRNSQGAVQFLVRRSQGCVRILQGIWLTRKLRVSMRHKMGTLRQVVSLGMHGAGTPEGLGRTSSISTTTRDNWLSYGYEMGWISQPVCYWHDMVPLSEEEEAILEEDDELCALVMRFYE